MTVIEIMMYFSLPKTQSNSDDQLSIFNIYCQMDVIVDPINVLRLSKVSIKTRPIRVILPIQYDVLKF